MKGFNMSLIFCILGVTATLVGLKRAKWFDIAAAIFHLTAMAMKLYELSVSFGVIGCAFVLVEAFTIFCCGMVFTLKMQQARTKKALEEFETRLTNARNRAEGEKEPVKVVCGGPGSGKKHYYISPDESKIIRFLLGEPVVVNDKALDINSIWKYDYTQLETQHDYIQWLFPLADASDYNPNAPVLTLADLVTITSHPAIRERLLRSLELMLDFYGFSLDWKTITVSQTDPKAWPPTYHNYLRITRILKSLTICGLNEYAVAFYNALLSVPDIEIDIPQTTLDYWKDAIYIHNFESEES